MCPPDLPLPNPPCHTPRSMGFNDQEMVALIGAHSLGRCHADRSGFDGPWTNGGYAGVLGACQRLKLPSRWSLPRLKPTPTLNPHSHPPTLPTHPPDPLLLTHTACSPHHLLQPLLQGADGEQVAQEEVERPAAGKWLRCSSTLAGRKRQPVLAGLA